MSEEMPRIEKAILFTMCNLELLMDKGFVKGEKRVAEKGWLEFESLKEEGFKPTEEELRSAMAALGAI